MKKINIYQLLIILIITIKLFLIGNLRLFLSPGYPYDDMLMLDMVKSLLDGDWLGNLMN